MHKAFLTELICSHNVILIDHVLGHVCVGVIGCISVSDLADKLKLFLVVGSAVHPVDLGVEFLGNLPCKVDRGRKRSYRQLINCRRVSSINGYFFIQEAYAAVFVGEGESESIFSRFYVRKIPVAGIACSVGKQGGIADIRPFLAVTTVFKLCRRAGL